MAKTILTALRFTRNDVSKLIRIFERMLVNAYESKNAFEDKNKSENNKNYREAIETIINFGFKAVQKNTLYVPIYQKYLSSYNYHMKLCFGESVCLFQPDAEIQSQSLPNVENPLIV